MNRSKRKHKNKDKLRIIDTKYSEEPTEEEKTSADAESDHVEHSDETSLKRIPSEDESDEEEKPKKKKKKQLIPTESSGKKGKKSIRQMKKEKFAQRQAEAKAAAKDDLKSECLEYLSQWKHDRTNWKFMKAKQGWLYKNMFSSHLVPNTSWPLLLDYFESAKGNIRNLLLDSANKIIKQMDEWTEKHSKENNIEGELEEADDVKPDETSYKRARDIIQCLHE